MDAPHYVSTICFVSTGILIGLILACKFKFFRTIICKEENCKEETCLKLTKKDAFYQKIILVFAAVASLTFALGDNESAISLFSFASTITSIILSVIAIFMTISSSQAQHSYMYSIDQSTKKFDNATEALTAQTNILASATKATNDLATRLDALSNTLSSIESKLDENTELTKQNIQTLEIEQKTVDSPSTQWENATNPKGE